LVSSISRNSSAGCVLDARLPGDAGAVDQSADQSEPVDHLVKHGGDLVLVGHIRAQHDQVFACHVGFELGHSLVVEIPAPPPANRLRSAAGPSPVRCPMPRPSPLPHVSSPEDNADCRCVKHRKAEPTGDKGGNPPMFVFLLIDASIKKRSLPVCQNSEWNHCAAGR
jgi:hypothetical protein